MKIRYLDGPRLRRALIAACDYAQRQRADLNRINVFPVPDGDTGTNLALTARAIADHLQGDRHREVCAVAYAAAQGAVVGARGNCGMMLSHFLLGFAEAVESRAKIEVREFAEALSTGTHRLYESLERPVEGTILTVMRDVAAAARKHGTRDFVPLVAEVVVEARRSLAATPDLLPVLKEAGVVDAGAKGFVSLIEGVHLFIHGDERLVVPSRPDGSHIESVSRTEYPSGEEQFRFCTEALVRGEPLPTQMEAREALRALGDSLIVIRAADVLKVHVHTDEPEEVFRYLRGVGTLVTHKAEDMRAQHDAIERAAGSHVQLARRPVTIVTDSACDLSEEVIRAHGIHVTPLTLVEGDRTYRDGIDITATEFHARMEARGKLPTTSQPTPGAFIETYRRALEEGEAVVGVMVSSTLSGTLSSAEAAAMRVEGDDIHLTDSLGASLLQGLLVLKAAELAEMGHSPADIVTEITRVRAQSGVIFKVGTLDRLVASGRVGRGRGLLGRILNLRPILSLDPQGTVVPVGKVFGRVQARSVLTRLLRQAIPVEARKVRFGVIHVGVREIVPELFAMLRAEYGDDVEILSSPATPVIATHVGVGTWGIAYMVED